MVTKCPYCDFQYPDVRLSLDILRVLVDPELPLEDYIVWFERLMANQDLHDYRGVKVHIGRKHKGEYNLPTNVFSEAEKDILSVPKTFTSLPRHKINKRANNR